MDPTGGSDDRVRNPQLSRSWGGFVFYSPRSRARWNAKWHEFGATQIRDLPRCFGLSWVHTGRTQHPGWWWYTPATIANGCGRAAATPRLVAALDIPRLVREAARLRNQFGPALEARLDTAAPCRTAIGHVRAGAALALLSTSFHALHLSGLMPVWAPRWLALAKAPSKLRSRPRACGARPSGEHFIERCLLRLISILSYTVKTLLRTAVEFTL